MMWLVNLHHWVKATLGARVYRLLRYLMSGGAAAASNLGILFILVHFGRMHYLSASIIAFLASVAVSFTLQKFWTFQDRPTHDVHAQFARYCVVVLFNLILNMALMFLLVDKAGLWYLLAQLLTTGAIAVVGYFGYKYFVFRERTVTP